MRQNAEAAAFSADGVEHVLVEGQARLAERGEGAALTGLAHLDDRGANCHPPADQCLLGITLDVGAGLDQKVRTEERRAEVRRGQAGLQGGEGGRCQQVQRRPHVTGLGGRFEGRETNRKSEVDGGQAIGRIRRQRMPGHAVARHFRRSVATPGRQGRNRPPALLRFRRGHRHIGRIEQSPDAVAIDACRDKVRLWQAFTRERTDRIAPDFANRPKSHAVSPRLCL